MDRYSLRHLSRQKIDRGLRAISARDRQTTADLLAYLAEAEVQRIYDDHGYSSMLTYCMGELRYSEDTALRRIGVARAARRFPAIYPAIADGRLNLTAVLLIKPHLRPENAVELLSAIANRTKREIERLIAERWPQALALERVGKMKVVPIAPGLYEIRVVVRQTTLDGLNRSRELMSHANPSGDMDVVLDRLARSGNAQMEKRKFAATENPRRTRSGASDGHIENSLPTRSRASDSRHLPAEVRRAVYLRDGGQCIFVDARGRRCESRHQLEYDHIVPVARGGTSTVGNLRLLCRAHNHIAAIATFGLAFMGHKIEEARAGRAVSPTSAGITG